MEGEARGLDGREREGKRKGREGGAATGNGTAVLLVLLR